MARMSSYVRIEGENEAIERKPNCDLSNITLEEVSQKKMQKDLYQV